MQITERATAFPAKSGRASIVVQDSSFSAKSSIASPHRLHFISSSVEIVRCHINWFLKCSEAFS
ncbi:DnaJ domain-containing protein [Prunus dulcis]|uniref:DnaJ domain-containing protein n=1 Tax=Prunus dulcis TaxID=3755 RepID=A0A4Y1S042_PRUDU|nr:DnaJ domain-containing protein [Prunus dulcis]